MSGEPGNYTLSFTLTNHTNEDMGLYVFAVCPEINWGIRGGGWVPYGLLNFEELGGPTGDFLSSWTTSTGGSDRVFGGQSMSGFDVFYWGRTVPTSIEWVAMGTSTTGYSEASDFSYAGFTGQATQSIEAVPEPASMAALGLALLRRRRKV
ncbi:PEP-CTERM sorting domain-containing protein [bacterium]|nr:MAG: PEP-CTERM sorting domain-containing protein [bacterium]